MLLGQNILPVASFSRLLYERAQLLRPRAQFNPQRARHAPSLTLPQFQVYSQLLCPPTFDSFRPTEICLSPVGVPLLFFLLLYSTSGAQAFFKQGDVCLGLFLLFLCCVLTGYKPLGRKEESNRSHRLYLYFKNSNGVDLTFLEPGMVPKCL